jgi:hypothetical protein
MTGFEWRAARGGLESIVQRQDSCREQWAGSGGYYPYYCYSHLMDGK